MVARHGVLTTELPAEANGTPVLPQRHRLEGHRIRVEVGATAVHTLDQLQAELRRITTDPASQVVDPQTGGRKLMACLIEPLQSTLYEDVARTADAANAAGFEQVTFAGGAGPR